MIDRDKISKALNFLFPLKVTCNACGRENFNDRFFCDDCESSLPKNDGIVCAHCGRQVFNAEPRCLSCKGRETHFEKARSVFRYEMPVNALIGALKYEGKRYLAEVFASYMASVYYASYFNCDFAVAVPMSEERLKERGYNHSELLAKKLCEIVKIPFDFGVIQKHKETSRQAELDAKSRAENLKGSFKILNKSAIANKRILLVDDVMTTGATVECLSELLIKGGAQSVCVLTVASVSKEVFFVRKDGKINNNSHK